MSNRIRKITIGKEPNSTMNYSLGSSQSVLIESKIQKRIISDMLLGKNPITEKFVYFVYLTNGEETHLWKELPINDVTSLEYVID